MRVIRVFPRRTTWTPRDELAFVGDPPLFRPENMPVKVSVTFTWDIAEGERLQKAWSDYYSDTQIGGPAFGDQGNEFIPGMFIKPGVVFTSRGCIRHCPWCVVPRREGKTRELDIKQGWIIQDNNFLSCSRGHIERVFAMLRKQKKSAVFSGGLDARLLKQWHIELFKTIKIKELWFACDDQKSLEYLKKASELLFDFPINKKRCYCMIGYNETLHMAASRLKSVYKMGFLPFSQLYQPAEKRAYEKEWRELNRRWSRPAIYRSKNFGG